METRHRTLQGDARDLALPDGAVDLVVTSPPYPMVEMWDRTFAGMAPQVEDCLAAGAGDAACELMHEQLDEAWAEVERVLAPGGIACVNVGDAVRRMGGSFRRFRNHARVAARLEDQGLTPLPSILWRKPTNSPAKFVGSGMLPTNAYPTLEHEHILVLRKGEDPRGFPPKDEDRYESAYFWEERNRWFTDVWTDVQGALQALEDDGLRERSAAFPFDLPYRLICMFSTYGDTVLDPFLGTGTTTLAAMVAARDSVGVESDAAFLDRFREQVDEVPALSRDVARTRLERHRDWAEERAAAGEDLGYEAEHYGFRVRTKQERRIRLHVTRSVEETDGGFLASHRPATDAVLEGGGGTERGGTPQQRLDELDDPAP
jgi:site-specific DNA-methyltransferase (cytosine-N4-specific)